MWRLLIVFVVACAEPIGAAREVDVSSPDSDVSAPEVDATDSDATEHDSDATEHDVDATDSDATEPDLAHDGDVEVDTPDCVSDPTGPTCPTRCVRGRLLREARRPNAEATALLDLAVVPVVDLEVTAVTSASATRWAATDTEGDFEICGLAADAPLTLRVTCEVRDRDAGGDPDRVLLAVVDGQEVDVPQRRGVRIVAQRLWSWSLSVGPASDEIGTWLIREGDGAGALAILAEARAVIARAATLFAGRAITPPTLGIVWSPARTPSCLSCYLPAAWGPLVLQGAPGAADLAFDRALFLSGAPSAPHHWTPSLVAHELGHFAMDTWSVLPDLGGPHGWDARVDPALAWSEGFATFFAQRALSTLQLPMPRFFSIQSNIPYWVDLDAIARDPRTDDTSLSLTIPLPSPSGGLTQPLGEGAVAALLWGLGSGVDPGRPDAVVVAVASLRVRTLDRGAPGPDLVDFLDALVCAYPDLDQDSLSPALIGFPYDFAPLCP
ncbi:MAG: hypothetical protein JNJ59_15230 [Deltaproteobacteria bacterium]|nr:hypothetical protein [Deltaproteobacteria bacterium]